jgi:hypothetical protein
MTSMIAYDEYDAVLASRILGKGALKGGMPMYKYISNRFLTFAENVLISEKFSEYHTGYRVLGPACKFRLKKMGWANPRILVDRPEDRLQPEMLPSLGRLHHSRVSTS